MRLRLFALAVALVTASLAAHADTISDFSASGTFNDGATLSGTIDMDVTLGSVLSADLTVSAPANTTFTSIQGLTAPEPDPSGFESLIMVYFGSTEDFLVLNMDTSTLAGYTGGALYTGSLSGYRPSEILGGANYLGVGEEFSFLSEGELTEENPTATTPEPSSIALLGAGLLCVPAVVRRRRFISTSRTTL